MFDVKLHISSSQRPSAELDYVCSWQIPTRTIRATFPLHGVSYPLACAAHAASRAHSTTGKNIAHTTRNTTTYELTRASRQGGIPSKNRTLVNAPQGFGTSSRRLALELGLVVVGLVVLGVVGWFGVGYAAQALVRSLPPESERTLGKTAWTSLAPESERCTNKRTLQYVGDVLRPLLAHQPPGYRFEYTVADDPALNAYALPGGYITVNMGLLNQIARSEELAGVLAHELAHVTERHGTRRMAAQLGLLAVVQLALGGTDLGQVAQLAAGLASTAYARDQEVDADTVGLQTLAAARVDPLGMAELFDRLADAHVSMPELLSTHPDPGKRAERARSAVPSGELRPLPVFPEGLACH